MRDHELEPYFSIREACRVLGFERTTLFSRIKEGRLRAVKLADGRVKVPRSELARYLAQATPITVSA